MVGIKVCGRTNLTASIFFFKEKTKWSAKNKRKIMK